MKRVILCWVVLGLLCVVQAVPKRKLNDSRFPHQACEEELVYSPINRIGFVLYTLHERTLKMSVQFYPLGDGDSRKVWLEVNQGRKWKKVATARVSEETYGRAGKRSWTALFRVENWDDTKPVRYRVVARNGDESYEGIIRKNPVDKNEIVVAAFTGNTWRDARMKSDIITNIEAQDPDLLFFSGDQVYVRDDHLTDWLHFGRQFGEITRNRPTVCLTDDHDIGNGNLWGEGGRDWPADGGLKAQGFGNPQFVRMVERAQCAHLPDPYDPNPIERGIGVYYTSLKIGRVDFAILEDRKFKSSPATLREALIQDHKGLVFQQNNPVGVKDAAILDIPQGKLLGDRQLAFLDDWATKWSGVDMKAVLSQTPLAKAHHTGKQRFDIDSNGWPQSARNRAVRALRKAFSVHINGDQHLASVTQYGVEAWRDSGYSFCVPSIYNHYTRRWQPGREPDGQPIDSQTEFTGDYYDTFGNRLTMVAYANPKRAWTNKWANEFGARAPGYGLIRFNLDQRRITFECWPRGVLVTQEDVRQYPGWPITVDQQDNYARKAVAWLPTLQVKGMKDPVVQVIEETSGEILYTLRIRGDRFTPKTFSEGRFTIRVGELGTAKEKTFSGIEARADSADRLLEVVLK